jgi:protein-tyrosine phosphatase
VLNYPISDVKEDEYMEQLFEASQHLFELIDKQGHHVFLHCSSGVSRGPTLALVYLSLFLKHKDWNNLLELHKWIRSLYQFSLANIDLAQRVIERHKEFQSR